ncbi:MAG: glycosyltransferase family 2 protein [Acidobacteria bacterium]|nr:MAG: glycosyltransferase family 2 protein [Acidobacteriota bacterium]MCE7959328.1 glycosyltransferase family 2 protein [Acidobacteria bacterium ACB2]
MSSSPSTATPELSIVAPARDEEPNLAPLVEEVERVVLGAGVAAELLVVDDGSTDGSVPLLAGLASGRPWLVPLRLDAPLGKSAALRAGILAARGRFVATLDADLQNDPADLVRLLPLLRAGEAEMVQGIRERRKDSLAYRAASGVGRLSRRLLLGDSTRDTGCATRLMTAELARRLPLDLEGLHRFLPLVARRLGARVAEVPVAHRPRLRGLSHYGLLDRALPGFLDCLGVRWYLSRRTPPDGHAERVVR